MSLRRRRHSAPATVAISPASAVKTSGDTQQYTKTLTNVHGAAAPITDGTWVSSNSAVASPNQSGLVTGGLIGTANINFVSVNNISDATPSTFEVDAAGAAAQVTFDTVPSTTATEAVALVQQPVVLVRDAAGNPVEGETVVATKLSGPGTLSGDVDIDTDVDGLATFTDLTLSAAGSVVLRFTANSVTLDSATITVSA